MIDELSPLVVRNDHSAIHTKASSALPSNNEQQQQRNHPMQEDDHDRRRCVGGDHHQSFDDIGIMMRGNGQPSIVEGHQRKNDLHCFQTTHTTSSAADVTIGTSRRTKSGGGGAAGGGGVALSSAVTMPPTSPSSKHRHFYFQRRQRQRQLEEEEEGHENHQQRKMATTTTTQRSSSCGGRTTTKFGYGLLLYILVVLGVVTLKNNSEWYQRYVVELNDYHNDDGSSSSYFVVTPSMMNAQLLADKVGLNNRDDDDDVLLLSSSLASAANAATTASDNDTTKSASSSSGHAPTTHSAAPNGCEATIVLVRHCEKGSLKSHCDYLGYERSVYLASLFGPSREDRYPSPTQIFALQPGHRHNPRHSNFREIETVSVVADKVNVTINSDYTTSSKGRLAKLLLRQIKHGQLCNKMVLVAWKHSDIPNLARKLGCGPLEGCPYDYKGKDFDSIWQLKYVKRSEFNNNRIPRKRRKKKRRHAEDDIRPTTSSNGYDGSWKVYGSVQNENFDPLQYSKLVGDYDDGTVTKNNDSYDDRKEAGGGKSKHGIPKASKKVVSELTRSAASNWEHKLPTPMQFN